MSKKQPIISHHSLNKNEQERNNDNLLLRDSLLVYLLFNKISSITRKSCCPNDFLIDFFFFLSIISDIFICTNVRQNDTKERKDRKEKRSVDRLLIVLLFVIK